MSVGEVSGVELEPGDAQEGGLEITLEHVEVVACVDCGADASRGGRWVTNLAGVDEAYCRTCASVNFPVV